MCNALVGSWANYQGMDDVGKQKYAERSGGRNWDSDWQSGFIQRTYANPLTYLARREGQAGGLVQADKPAPVQAAQTLAQGAATAAQTIATPPARVDVPADQRSFNPPSTTVAPTTQTNVVTPTKRSGSGAAVRVDLLSPSSSQAL